MHPGMFAWWRAHRQAACGGGDPSAECGVGLGGHGWRHAHGVHELRWGAPPDGDELGGGFGVRRPLRFLAFKLDLDDAQVSELASVLAELKTERAQAAVDHRRTTASFADAVAAEAFDEAKVREAAADRVKSAEALRSAVVKALGRIHALLRPEQRAKLAYLLRTGALSV